MKIKYLIFSSLTASFLASGLAFAQAEPPKTPSTTPMDQPTAPMPPEEKVEKACEHLTGADRDKCLEEAKEGK